MDDLVVRRRVRKTESKEFVADDVNAGNDANKDSATYVSNFSTRVFPSLWHGVSVTIGLLIGIGLCLGMAEYLQMLHENMLWFSSLKELEREISFKADQAFYYSFFKNYIRSPNSDASLRSFEVEFSRQGGVIPTERFNVFPESVLASLYLFLAPAQMPASIFYADCVFGIQMLLVASIFLISWSLAGSWLAGLIAVGFFALNRDNATRVPHGVGLREAFGLPFLFAQLGLLGWIIVQRESQSKKLERVLQNALISLCATSAGIVAVLSWQMTPYLLTVVVLSLLVLRTFRFAPAGRVMIACICIAASIFAAWVIQPLPYLLRSPALTGSLIVCLNCVYTPLSYFERKFRGLQIEKIVPPLNFVVTLGAGILVWLAVNDVVGGGADDDHILRFFWSRILGRQDISDLEVQLYVCHDAFDLLGQDTILSLTGTFLFPLYNFFVCLWGISFVVYLRDSGKGIRSTKSLNDDGKTKHLSLFSLLTIGRADLVLHIGLSLAFGIGALLMKRLLCLWVPYMCILVGAGVADQRMWSICLGPDCLNKSQAKKQWPAKVGRIGVCVLILSVVGWKLEEKVRGEAGELREFYDPDSVSLMDWILSSSSPTESVFAGSMQLMATVHATTGRAITNHPHFENAWLRNRTKEVYQIYGHLSPEKVHKILSAFGTTHIIVEESLCTEAIPSPVRSGAQFCRLVDLVDLQNGHVPTTMRNIPDGLDLKPPKAPLFCSALDSHKSSIPAYGVNKMAKSNDFLPYGNFEPKIVTDIDGKFPVVVYESTATKLRVAVLQVDGPLVNGYLLVPTEPTASDGLPHTLEHLVFLGSEEYPFKGVLDLLANRCLANGTNAWTAMDSTVYTVKTVGGEGFCNILPIYMDHVLYPTLKDAAYTTEVYHVTGEGKDGGVVYSELQTSENTCKCKAFRKSMELLYPNSNYRYDQGGLMEDLRMTNNEQVKAYHKRFYRPENLVVIVTGKVEPVEILKALDPIEQKIIKKGPHPEPYVRPWNEPLEPLSESVDTEILYPADELKHGLVEIAFRGPAVMDLRRLCELDIILDYMIDTAISPMRKMFVEIPEPLASSVSHYIMDNQVTAVFFTFENVPADKLGVIKEKFWAVLKGLTEATLDMNRVQTIIRKKVFECWSALESDPHSAVSDDAITFATYGDSADDLTFMLNSDKYMDVLLGKNAAFWIKILKEYFDEAKPHVTIRARPCKELKAKLAAEEEARVEERVRTLGPEGLKQKKETLDQAVEANEVEPEDDMMTSVPIPNMENLNFLSIKLYSNYVLNKESKVINSAAPHFDLSKIPIRMRVDDVNSNFVRIRMALDTTNLDPGLRLYLLLYLALIGESALLLPPGFEWHGVRDSSDRPIVLQPDGSTLVPYEIVVKQIETDTEGVGAHLGLSAGGSFSAGIFANYVMFFAKVEIGKYKEGIRWLRDLLFFTHVQPDRVQVAASKIAQSVNEKKLKGGTIAKALVADMQYVKGSNPWAVSLLRQQKVLNQISRDLSEALPSNPKADDLPVIQSLIKLREFFVGSANSMILYMATDLERLHEKQGGVGSLEQPWVDIMLESLKKKAVVDEPMDFTKPLVMVPDVALLARTSIRLAAGSSECDSKTGCIVGMGSVESAYIYQTIPTEVQSMLHPDFPALMVFLEYLNQAEGPLWKGVRGQGLSYVYSLSLNTSNGMLSLILGMAAQPVDAFRVASEIIKEHVTEGFELEEDLFEAAKSSTMYGLVSNEESVADLVQLSLMSGFRGIPVDFTRTLMDRIWKLDEEEVVSAGRKYVTPVLDPTKSLCAAVCHSAKVDDIVSAFKLFGRNLHPFESVEASFLSDM
ncbi:unnamed protein product [Notodromas monacha]|uniref:Uncharacterized protein n=1 Tax=Notodromas monacha TaxID=399045 RepID=A0A7R9BIQ4_9CRUS|nr:unnamed protein product [Notodromas monacha]CAG0916251.1 unnamed protein product [Notodromas monacha]